jgi:hypothetical protein
MAWLNIPLKVNTEHDIVFYLWPNLYYTSLSLWNMESSKQAVPLSDGGARATAFGITFR